jgi:hypothetical protein
MVTPKIFDPKVDGSSCLRRTNKNHSEKCSEKEVVTNWGILVITKTEVPISQVEWVLKVCHKLMFLKLTMMIWSHFYLIRRSHSFFSHKIVHINKNMYIIEE